MGAGPSTFLHSNEKDTDTPCADCRADADGSHELESGKRDLLGEGGVERGNPNGGRLAGREQAVGLIQRRPAVLGRHMQQPGYLVAAAERRVYPRPGTHGAGRCVEHVPAYL